MPLQYAGCYLLDLYCDQLKAGPGDSTTQDGIHGYAEFPHQFTGSTFGQCAKQAKAKGWRINQMKRTARCPKCEGKP